MAVNIDGTDLMAYADPHSGPAYQNAVAVAEQRIFVITGDGPGPLGGGSLEFVSRRRPLRWREKLAPSDDGWHLSPRPVSGGGLIVSYLARRDDHGYELFRVDPETGGRLARIAAERGSHLIDAQELAPRPEVSGRSSVVDRSAETGVFYCLSSHISDRPALRAAARSAVRLRVVEGMPQAPGGSTTAARAERVLGVLEIEDDGSFHVEVPASTPVRFELLGPDGEVVARQDHWVWVMPRESRGCVGCHEDREMAPPNILAEAVVKPAVRLPRSTSVAADPSGGAP
jgi:hypothetical protein